MSKFSDIISAKRELEPMADHVTAPARATRKPGKRSDPDFAQVSAWLRKDTHQSVKVALLQEGQGREFSELVEHLLTEWLGDRVAK